MSLFRSQDMTLCQLYLQTESAYAAISELGELGVIQFKDLNSDVNAFQRKFVNEVRRCEEMERQLRYFEKELNTDLVVPEEYLEEPRAPGEQDLIDFEATFESLESQLKEIANSLEALGRNYYELLEMRHVLKLSQDVLFENSDFLGNPSNDISFNLEMSDMTGIVDNSRVQLEYVTGVVQLERLNPFMRLLWRACRGMTYVRYVEIPEDIHDINLPPDSSAMSAEVRKVVFTVFFSGEQLKTRVRKICDGFHARIYPCPSSASDRSEMMRGINTRITDLDLVIKESQEQRRRVLASIAKNLTSWMTKIYKVKAIYHTLNMLRVEYQSFIGEGWCPVDRMSTIQEALTRAAERSGSTVPSLIHRMESEALPTYHRTNKFTSAFQTIIDAYGMASYKEVNPALFSIISFPFLFSVMFGDAGHGVLVTAAATWMLIREKSFTKAKSSNEIWNIFFGGRYLIFLMGVFSIYSGLMYNDVFSKSLNIFGSSWSAASINETQFAESKKDFLLDPNVTAMYTGKPYPFGMDPVWQLSSNKITFTNSYKKKISVIFGIVQMVFGIFLSLANQIYFRRWLDVFTEFIPQLLFILSIFGYLVIEIIVKWVMFSAADSACAPSLLIGLINMVMFKDPGHDAPCALQMWYPNQYGTQIFLVLLAVMCVPWMLLTKPLILRWRHKRSTTVASDRYQRLREDRAQTVLTVSMARRPLVYMVDMNPSGDLFGESSSDTQILTECSSSVATAVPTKPPAGIQDFDFGEVFIHQMIHTIEFCLGCISHTASYLRLWALSLAHAELSEVLWEMVLRFGFMVPGFSGFIVLAAVFLPWAVLTVAILLVMEGLSAFLHTLRLHWVEFQSKFYKGEGFPFEPFYFPNILSNLQE